MYHCIIPMRRMFCFLSILLVIILCFPTVQVSSASNQSATAITVNSTLDFLQAGDGLCTLREAINNANRPGGGDGTGGDCAAGQAAPAVDTIALPAGVYTLTIAGANENNNATGDLDILSSGGDLILQGADAATTILQACDGAGCAGIDRVLNTIVPTGGTANNVTISGVTLRHGLAANKGGGLYNQQAYVTILNCIVSDNSSRWGAGIENFQGSVTISNCNIFHNSAAISSGGVDNLQGELILQNSYIYNNVAGTSTTNENYSGGIDNANGSAFIYNSTIANNLVIGTDSNNGGGIGNNLGSLTIANSTISGNRVMGTGGNGGGIYNVGDLNLIDTTIANNQVLDSGSLGGGLYDTLWGATRIKNSILAKNNASIGGDVDCLGDDVPETLYSNNIIQNIHTCVYDGTGVRIQSDPKLGPLANYGGPTLTMALLANSPAIDAVSDCTDLSKLPDSSVGNAITKDQRGMSRPYGVKCDIGAVELQAGGSPHLYYLPSLMH